MKQLLSRDHGVFCWRNRFHVIGRPHCCCWSIQLWCAWTMAGMHSSSCRHGWMVLGLRKKVNNWMQMRKDGKNQSWSKFWSSLSVAGFFKMGRVWIILKNVYTTNHAHKDKEHPSCPSHESTPVNVNKTACAILKEPSYVRVNCKLA